MPTRETARVVTRRTIGTAHQAKAPVAFPFARADVDRISVELAETEELAARRRAAWDVFQSMPVPTVHDEAWRRTDLADLPLAHAAAASDGPAPVEAGLLQPLVGESKPALMVLTPGQPTRLEGVERITRQGVVFADWATAVAGHSDKLEEHLGRLVPPADGKFAALAAALGRDGVLVYVPAGVKAADPLHSVLWAPARAGMRISRLLVVVDRDAELTYVHEAASPTEAEASSMHAGTVELIVAEGARLTFVELQSWGEHVWNLTHERAHVGRGGHLEWIFGAVGSRLTKNFTTLDLVGEGAEGRMSGFYFADGVQHLDHDTQQNHRAPHTTSDLLFKGALVGRSRSVWQGMIYVAPEAQKTDGYQANRNLLLSPQARADSIPGLEILADDVRCTHGATVGQLEAEPIFYLMSRGLPRREAERMVVDGFFAPVLERIPFEGVRDRFRLMIEAKMG
jgi:Fe-S cluster assembly protein SufD